MGLHLNNEHSGVSIPDDFEIKQDEMKKVVNFLENDKKKKTRMSKDHARCIIDKRPKDDKDDDLEILNVLPVSKAMQKAAERFGHKRPIMDALAEDEEQEERPRKKRRSA